MRITKGGIWRFKASKMYAAFYDAVLEVCIIAARRAEEEARTILQERMIGEKSSGTLEESIFGFTDLKPNAIFIGIMASAFEEGQWEEGMGEPEEASKAISSPPFDYAMAVEQGTGIFRQDDEGNEIGELIEANPEFVFWTGEYTESGSRELVHTPYIQGQKALHYLRDALLFIQPQIDEMLEKVFNKKVNMDDFWEVRND